MRLVKRKHNYYVLYDNHGKVLVQSANMGAVAQIAEEYLQATDGNFEDPTYKRVKNIIHRRKPNASIC